ncbi:MAG: hypothetical protein ACYTF0_08835 [Planctomycetota bacterium]|jgi:hypothetical protein
MMPLALLLAVTTALAADEWDAEQLEAYVRGHWQERCLPWQITAWGHFNDLNQDIRVTREAVGADALRFTVTLPAHWAGAHVHASASSRGVIAPGHVGERWGQQIISHRNDAGNVILETTVPRAYLPNTFIYADCGPQPSQPQIRIWLNGFDDLKPVAQ